jgi:hypothetical protein
LTGRDPASAALAAPSRSASHPGACPGRIPCSAGRAHVPLLPPGPYGCMPWPERLYGRQEDELVHGSWQRGERPWWPGRWIRVTSQARWKGLPGCPASRLRRASGRSRGRPATSASRSLRCMRACSPTVVSPPKPLIPERMPVLADDDLLFDDGPDAPQVPALPGFRAGPCGPGSPRRLPCGAGRHGPATAQGQGR